MALAASFITAGPLTGFASTTLTNIPFAPWGADSSNEGRAISPDGGFVVGVSGTVNGYLFDVTNYVVVQPNAATAVPGSAVTGIAYRTDPVSGDKQLVLDGMSSGFQMNWMTTNGGVNWGAKRRDTTFTPNVQSVVNTLGASTGSDVFYTIIRSSGNSAVYTIKGTNTWTASVAPWVTNNFNKSIPSPDTAAMNGIAATGRAVGYRQTGGTKNNYILDYPPSSATAANFKGLSGTNAGQAFSVSADGTRIFGQSPIEVGGTIFHGYKAVVTAAIPGVQSSVDPLPNFNDTGGSVSLAVPYGCTADGKYAVGMNYRGIEKAVLWDTTGSDPAIWSVVDLTDLAAERGILDIFTRIHRAYSAGTNAAGEVVITGVGIAGGVTRGFVMTVAPQDIPRRLKLSGSFPAGFAVTLQSAPGTTAYLEYTTDLTPTITWNPVTSTPGTGAAITLSDPNPGGLQRFYHIRVQ